MVSWKCRIRWHKPVETGPDFNDKLICGRSEDCTAEWKHEYDFQAPSIRRVW